jgi:glycosyltransferase involved in cell wall biosynthesis
MRIVHVLWSLGTGGTESLLADIVSEQSITDCVSLIVVNDIIDETVLKRISKKCSVYFCRRKAKSKNPFPIIKLNILLWMLSPDIIHSHMDNLGKYLRFRRNAKVVRTIHCAMGNENDNAYYDQLFTISNGVKKYTQAQGYDSIVVYNGIHPELIACKSEHTHQITQIVNVGRLQKVKGQQVLVEAAHLLKERNINNFHIDLIGDGENRNYLENMIAKYRLQKEVSLLGLKTRNYIYSNLCSYDLYVQPSISEGFGLTISEAMAAGVPVLTSDQDGPMEVIDYGKYGMSFKTNQPEDLADKIELFLNKGTQVDTFSALNYVKSNFDVKVTARKYLQEYKKLLEK